MDTTREWFVEPEGDRTFTIDGTDYNVTQEEFDRAARELTKIAQTGHGHLTLETVDKPCTTCGSSTELSSRPDRRGHVGAVSTGTSRT